MSTQTGVMRPEADPDPDVVSAVPEGLAEQLVARARAPGISLTGRGGLLSGLTKQVLETALNAEMAEHLGHEHGAAPVGGNVRNGYSAKTVRTEIVDVAIQVPGDRAGSFEPVMVPKHAPGRPGSMRL